MFDRDPLSLRQSFRFPTAMPFAAALLFSFAAMLCSPVLSAAVAPAVVRVQVIDFESGNQLSGVRVDAYERLASGKRKWRARRTTGGDGSAEFAWDSLRRAGGASVVFRTKVFGSPAYSRDVSVAGSYKLTVGQLNLTVVSGANGLPLSGHRIDIKELLATGKQRWVGRGTTDANGMVRLDPPGLGTGRVFVALAKSPINGKRKLSQPISDAGRHVFEVGNKPLEVSLIDALENTPLPGIRVDAYERVSGGKLKWRGRARTDDGGNAMFDIDRLGEPGGPVVFLRARPFGTKSYSEPISTPGAMKFLVGRLELAVVSGVNGEPLRNYDVQLRERLADGKSRWVGRGRTDQDGNIRFDPIGLGTGPEFFGRAKSPVNGRRKDSQPITHPGRYQFVVGNAPLAVKLIDAATGNALAGMRIAAFRRLDDGTKRWAGRQTTDASGMAMFDLDGLGDGVSYFLTTKPYNAGRVYSPAVTQTGDFVFQVGTVPVTLSDRDQSEVMPGHRITAYEKLPDGTLKWRRSGYTDADGLVRFDLPGLSDGATYVLRVKNPFGNNHKYYSDPITAEGPVAFAISRNDDPDFDDEAPVVTVSTPSAGETVSVDGFDVTGFATDNKQIESVTIDIPGKASVTASYDAGTGKWRAKVEAALLSAESLKLTARAGDKAGNQAMVEHQVMVVGDVQPPQLTISSPESGMVVSADGFAVSGTATDNKGVASVLVRVGSNETAVPASYDPADQTWTAMIGAALLQPGSVVLTVLAADAAGNESSAMQNVTVSGDNERPVITVTEPVANQAVASTGFAVRGTVTDNQEVASLRATLTDPQLGVTIDDQPVIVNSDSFELVVLGGQVSAGATATLSLRAQDAAGNESTLDLSLLVNSADNLARHLVNRTTFGEVTGLLREVETVGVDIFVEEQMDSEALDDSEFQRMLSDAGTPSSKSDLQELQLLHAIHSKFQLREVMTWFWDNHFSTNVNTSNSGQDNTVQYEWQENQAFRSNAFGRFRDLVGISAKSPSMLIYLDGISNVASDPNENYPRELMELHTLGVDGGYTQEDVEEVARAFTGWQISNGAFAFNAGEHDSDAKRVLDTDLPAGRGIEDGEQVLDILSAHTSTAGYICGKLVTLFVNDDPPRSLVDRCATKFGETVDASDQIAQVLNLILLSPEFNDPINYRAKTKNPLELVAGFARNFEAAGSAADLPGATRRMGMSLFEYPVPTGFSELGEDWINSALLLERMKFVDRMAFNTPGANRTSVDLVALMRRLGATTPEAVLAVLFDLAHDGEYTTLEWDTAMAVLTDDGQIAFDINAPEADAQLRSLLGIALSFPGYQYH